MKKLLNFVKIFFTDPKWEKVKGLFWFGAITLIVHVIWRFWATSLTFYPLGDFIFNLKSKMALMDYQQVVFILQKILHVPITTYPHLIVTRNFQGIYFSGGVGLKQSIQFAILILVLAGPWRHKLWFIPLGIILLHFTNIFRILCMVIIAMHWPDQIHYAHDNYLRMLFYLVIFVLWIVWVEKISTMKQGGIKKAED